MPMVFFVDEPSTGDLATYRSPPRRNFLTLAHPQPTSTQALVDMTSSGWNSAIRQADDVHQLVNRIEAGTFEFNYEGYRG
ncbi:hypothetical protein ACLQ28_33165 [Micromonospora sp. DT201]|uniref:hypothetical protein n=1 Tax=Micromonospora sp. DT201 TaxID=3393442 RepID=UPI003CF44A0D